MKTEVYSWRASADLKSTLERQARLNGKSLSAVLDEAAREWLARTAADPSEEKEQARLHAQLSRAIGTISGGQPDRSETARKAVRARIQQRSAR